MLAGEVTALGTGYTHFSIVLAQGGFPATGKVSSNPYPSFLGGFTGSGSSRSLRTCNVPAFGTQGSIPSTFYPQVRPQTRKYGTRTHVHTYTRTHVHTYTRTHVHTYTRTHVHTYTRTHVHMYTGTQVGVYYPPPPLGCLLPPPPPYITPKTRI